MRKYLLGGVILFCSLFLVGCDNETKGSDKTLVCTQRVTVVDVELNTHFKNDTISGMDLKYTMDLSNYSSDQINKIKAQDYCTIVKNAMPGFTNAFNNCKQNISSKELLITADFDIDKITGMNLKTNESIDQVKKEIESVGYNCSIR